MTLEEIARRAALPRLATWLRSTPKLADALVPARRSTLVLVPARTGDINAYMTERHYLHRGRTMAQVGYWLLLDPAAPVLPGASAQRAKGAPWTLAGQPIAGAVLYALPRVSKRLYGFHPMELLELARLYLEPGPDGRNPKDLASRAIRATVKAVERDWIEEYPNLPAPRGIVSWADSSRHVGTVYEASGFVKLGLTKGGDTRTRTGAPEHADLDAPKLAYVLPLHPPEPQTNYALRLVLLGVSRDGADEVCDLVASEARRLGLAVPPPAKRCFYERGIGGEFIFPLGPSGVHGDDEEGAMPLGDVAERLGEVFVEATMDPGITYIREDAGEREWEIIRFTGAHYRRDRKTGKWGVERKEEQTMPVDDLMENPRRPTLAAFARAHGLSGALARVLERQAGPVYDALAGPMPRWLAEDTVEGAGRRLLPVTAYSDIGPQSGMVMRRWGTRVFAVDPNGEYATTEVRPDEITGWPAFVKNVRAETSTARLVESAQRIRSAWVLTEQGRNDRIAFIRARVAEIAKGQPMFTVFSSSGDDEEPRENPTGRVVQGERVFVYRNLHTSTWSVRSVRSGLVVAHPQTVYLGDVRFRVSEAGRQRVIQQRRKGVHAGLEGTVLALNGPPPLDLSAWVGVTYDPYRYATFVERAPPHTPVAHSPRAYLDAALHVFADRPIPVASADVPIRRNPGEETEIVLDSEGRKYPARYEVVEVALDGRSTVMVSHDPKDLTEWTPGYPQSFQSRDLGGIEEQAKIRTIAAKLDPIRLLAKNLDPTLGAPVVWEAPDGRLPALGGNGRILGFILAPEERYQAYLRMGRRLWPCFPQEDASPGHRWMLLRVVSGIDQAAATQLAAASQQSTAAEEGRMGKALSLLRSLQLKLEALPPVNWTGPLARENMPDFWRANPGFVQAILAAMDPAKRASYMNDADRLTPVVLAVMLAFLPAAARKPGVYEDSKVEDALFGALPAMITVRSLVQSGNLWENLDLLSALPDALDVFAYLRANRLTFKALKERMEEERRQGRIADARRISDVNDLGLALAAALYNAARRAAPEVAISEILTRYVQELTSGGERWRYSPRERGLFGAGSPPDAGPILAHLVPGFALPGEEVPDDAPPALLRAANPRAAPRPGLARLIFDGRSFGPSDARTWCKKHGYYPGVPQHNARGDVVIEQSGGTERRMVTLERGVAAAFSE